MFCGASTAIPASAGPPSLVLKYLICAVVGLASVIVHATIEPSRGTFIGLWVVPTLTWKPVVRLTARHGLAGQLGTAGVLASPTTPISASVAGATAGIASAAAEAEQGDRADSSHMRDPNTREARL